MKSNQKPKKMLEATAIKQLTFFQTISIMIKLSVSHGSVSKWS